MKGSKIANLTLAELANSGMEEMLARFKRDFSPDGLWGLAGNYMLTGVKA